MRVDLTSEQKVDATHGSFITLTDAQVARIKAMLSHQESERRAMLEFQPVIDHLIQHTGWEIELFHTGGGIYVVSVIQDDFNVVAPDGILSQPYVWISDDVDGKRNRYSVGAYLHYEDDEAVMVNNVMGGDLRSVVERAFKGLEARAQTPQTPEQWLGEHAFGLREAEERNIIGPTPPEGWEVQLMVFTNAIHATEYGGNRYYEAYGPMIVKFDDGTMQRFALWWTDFVANDWTEWFDNYDLALDRFAHLFLAVAHQITFDEMEPIGFIPIEGGTQDMLTHMQKQHGDEDSWPVMIWWDTAAHTTGQIESDTIDGEPGGEPGDGFVLYPYFDSSKNGDETGPSTYYCGLCEQRLDLGDLEEMA